MIPSFFDFFQSFYYENTYLPPVDLSEKALSPYFLQTEDPLSANKIQGLISDPEVRSALSEPLTYDFEKARKKSEILIKKGFKPLSVKSLKGPTGPLSPFYSVLEHDKIKGLIIKTGAIRVLESDFIPGPMNDKNEMARCQQEESLLRIAMANRIAKIAKEAEIEVVLPKKRLVSYADSDAIASPTEKYCIICEKLDVLSFEQTVQAIKNLNIEAQKELARKITTIVEKAGLVDASFHNIRLTPEGKVAVIDTEPMGLMVMKKSGLRNVFFPARGSSVEKCARIGLFVLMYQTTKARDDKAGGDRMIDPELQGFHDYVEKEYKRVSNPKLSYQKIMLSIASFGIIPIVVAVAALVKSIWARITFEKIQDLKFDSQEKQPDPFFLLKKSRMDRVQNTKLYSEKINFFADLFFRCIEGVPHHSPVT